MKWLRLSTLVLLLVFQSCASYQPFDAELAERLYQKQLAEENAELNRLQDYKAQMLSAADRGEITHAEAAGLIYKAEVDYDERKKQKKFKEKEQSLEEDKMENDRIYQQKLLQGITPQKNYFTQPSTVSGADITVNQAPSGGARFLNALAGGSSYAPPPQPVIVKSSTPLKLRCRNNGFGTTTCDEQ